MRGLRGPAWSLSYQQDALGICRHGRTRTVEKTQCDAHHSYSIEVEDRSYPVLACRC